MSAAHAPRARHGQILVITAFSMFVLMGIAALVFDLGMSWMLHRKEQNAADAGAIAAARYIEDGDHVAMKEAACFYAKENGFFAGDDEVCSDADAPDPDGFDRFDVLWPPSGPHAGSFAGRPEMVLVVIREKHPTFFARMFGQSEATVATGAVAARESQSANSNSLVALDPDSCAAGHVHGNGTVVIEPVTNPESGTPYSGGYIHVNSACSSGAVDDACGSGDGGLKKSGNSGSLIRAPHVYVHGTCQVAGGQMQSPVTEGAPQIGDPLAQLVGPRQEDYPAGYCPRKQGSMIVYDPVLPTDRDGCSFNVNGMSATLTPGVYYGGWKFSGNDVTVKLLPGIYIIAGGGITATGSATISSIGADPTTDPARVLIFSTDNTTDPTCTDTEAGCIQGAVQLSGQSSLKIWGLDSGQWRGLLIWQDRDGSNPTAPISIVGQGAMNIAGTIYAPLAHVKLEGNGAGTAVAAVQIISWTWDIGGNGDIYMPYDPSQLYRMTQRGLVH